MAHVTTRLPAEASPTTQTSDERSFLRWAGWSGLAATLAFVVSIVVNNAGGPASPETSGEILGYLGEVSDAGWSSYIYGIAGIILCVLYIPMAIGIHRMLGRSTTAWYGSTAVVVGLAALFPAYVINLLDPIALAPAANDLAGAGTETLYVVYAYASGAAEAFFTVGSVLSLGIGPLLWGVEWLGTRADRRWIGWTGVITGVSGMVWFVWLFDTPVVLIVLLANVVFSLVLFTGASLALVSQGRPAH